MRQLFREPLLQFAVLGIGLFVLYRLLSGNDGPSQTEIVVDAARIEALATQYARTRQRQPTGDELRGLVDAYVRDEVLYREGVALGLDRDDPVVRNRIRVRMEQIADTVDPVLSNEDVRAWFDSHQDLYSTPARYDFEQVFFSTSTRGSRIESDAAAALEALLTSDGIDAAELGDPTLLPSRLRDVTAADVAAQFGSEFWQALHDAPLGTWIGPVRSTYGLHVLRVDERNDGERATLATVRESVERDLRDDRVKAANNAMYEKLRSRYVVRVEMPTAGSISASTLAPGTP